MRHARLRIHRLPPCRDEQGLSQLDGRDREAVEAVSHYLDNLGTLVARDLLDIGSVATFLGLSACSIWDELAPFIRAERRTKPKRESYQRHFEDMVARLNDRDLAGEIGRLRRAPAS